MNPILSLLFVAAVSSAAPESVKNDPELQAASEWVARMGQPTRTPVSFLYGSRKSAELLPVWKQTTESRPIGSSKTEHHVTWNDPKTGLVVMLDATEFKDFPAVEWVVRFKNGGTVDTPILEDILPLDASLPAVPSRPAVLHYSKGALCSINDFAPVQKTLQAGAQIHLQPGGGRSSSEVLPFFNLDQGREGIVMGIGWTGEWAADFDGDTLGNTRLRTGMARTHLSLHPGEEIRTPRILVLAWKGESVRGNNLLRRFLLAHHRPQPNGKPIVLPVLVGSWGGSPATEHRKTIDRLVKQNLPIGLYWIDAEWFGKAPWFFSNGNWDVRKDLYPAGFRAISEPLHQAGKRLLLWFEPQRVCRGTPWASSLDRPGWLLELKKGTPAYKQRNMNWGVPHEDPRWVERESHRSQITEGDMLWNMGDPAARKFLTDWLSARIDEFGLDWYREDFNIAPLEYWQEADAPDRQGMTEIRYIEGLYAMWDALLERHPGLAIDNCASGGRRIDLETIGRATALWRTDWPVDARHRQCHTFGLMSWVPLHMSDGAVLAKGNEYEIRSAMTAGLNVRLPEKDDDASTKEARRLLDQYLAIQRFFYGDYYPLTDYSQADDAWLAYQLHLPDSGEGLVVVLKRPKSPRSTMTLRMHGLAADQAYEVVNLDKDGTSAVVGRQLLEKGVEVQLDRQPDAALLRYRLKPDTSKDKYYPGTKEDRLTYRTDCQWLQPAILVYADVAFSVACSVSMRYFVKAAHSSFK